MSLKGILMHYDIYPHSDVQKWFIDIQVHRIEEQILKMYKSFRVPFFASSGDILIITGSLMRSLVALSSTCLLHHSTSQIFFLYLPQLLKKFCSNVQSFLPLFSSSSFIPNFPKNVFFKLQIHYQSVHETGSDSWREQPHLKCNAMMFSLIAIKGKQSWSSNHLQDTGQAWRWYPIHKTNVDWLSTRAANTLPLARPSCSWEEIQGVPSHAPHQQWGLSFSCRHLYG